MEFFGVNPGRRIAEYFLGAIAVGTILLLLPISAGKAPVSFIDAMFTATSAVCVTGLTTIDTGSGFSLFGQIVILILIQLGGLGIMTFATALFASFGSKLSFGDRLGLSQSFLTGHGGRSTSLLKAIILTTFSLEFLGAVALFLRFQSQYPKLLTFHRYPRREFYFHLVKKHKNSLLNYALQKFLFRFLF